MEPMTPFVAGAFQRSQQKMIPNDLLLWESAHVCESENLQRTVQLRGWIEEHEKF